MLQAHVDSSDRQHLLMMRSSQVVIADQLRQAMDLIQMQTQAIRELKGTCQALQIQCQRMEERQSTVETTTSVIPECLRRVEAAESALADPGQRAAAMDVGTVVAVQKTANEALEKAVEASATTLTLQQNSDLLQSRFRNMETQVCCKIYYCTAVAYYIMKGGTQGFPRHEVSDKQEVLFEDVSPSTAFSIRQLDIGQEFSGYIKEKKRKMVCRVQSTVKRERNWSKFCWQFAM